MTRRDLLRLGFLAVITAPFAALFRKRGETGTGYFWQIDPDKCVQCGKCETECILPQSAVKCVHQYASCGYCLFCSGYYQDKRIEFNTAGENMRCPTDAIIRTYVEDPYFEYKIDEERCIGCGKCVKGCLSFGNGSLFLQVRRDLCKNCNECRIAKACPADAFVRVPAEKPYIYRKPPEVKS